SLATSGIRPSDLKCFNHMIIVMFGWQAIVARTLLLNIPLGKVLRGITHPLKADGGYQYKTTSYAIFSRICPNKLHIDNLYCAFSFLFL
ncbi:hypothetical protein ACJX0J_031347, partial [Zea mays]